MNETLMLVSTGSVPRECRVQVPLIDLLCDYGADPDSATHASALHGEFDAINALIARGAQVDLPLSAALGRMDDADADADARRLVAAASPEERHLALALASQFGHVEVVRLLLDLGEDPSRYNPVGGHAHSTPLHQAAWGGHEDVVRLLVERGARVDMKDILWHATPAGWAHHAGRTAIEAYLRAQEEGNRK
jgi:ankyrin repeat protein